MNSKSAVSRVDTLLQDQRVKESICMEKMTKEEQFRMLPDYIVYYVLGVTVEGSGGKDTVLVKVENRIMPVHNEDWNLAVKVGEKIKKELLQGKEISKYDVIRIRYHAVEVLNDLLTVGEDKFRLLYLMGEYTGCGWYRMDQPAKYIDEYCERLRAVCFDRVSYMTAFDFDGIVVQRRVTAPVFSVIKEWKKVGKRIMWECDDFLEDIPDFNPFKKEGWSDLKIAEANAMAELSEVIITSTPMLKEYYEKRFKKKVIVLPNFLDRYKWPDKMKTPDRGLKDDVRILWSGSSTHAGDFGEVIKALEYILKEYPKVKLVFFGYIHPEIETRWKARCEFYPWVKWHSYPEQLSKLDGEIGIAPLTNHPFNKYKSNIKFQEYSRLGVPTIASNIEPYSCIDNRRTGILVESSEEWKSALVDLIENPSIRVELGRRAQLFINEGYNGEKLVKKFEKELLEILK